MDIKLMPKKYDQIQGAGKSSVALNGARFIPKQESFVISSIILLIVVVLISAGLWWYEYSLNKEKDNLNAKLQELANQRDLDLEANFTELKDGIDNLKKLLDNHIRSSGLFVMVEELSLPQVQFVSFGSDLLESTLSLDVKAASYNVFAKQVVVFQQDERIKNVTFSEVVMDDDGGVSSSLKLELDPNFLRQ